MENQQMSMKFAHRTTLAMIMAITSTACIDPPPPQAEPTNSMSADAGQDLDQPGDIEFDMAGDMPAPREDMPPEYGALQIVNKTLNARMQETLVVNERIPYTELLEGLTFSLDGDELDRGELEITDVQFSQSEILIPAGQPSRLEARKKGITTVTLFIEHARSGQREEFTFDAHVGELDPSSYSRVHNIDLDLARSNPEAPIFTLDDVSIVREAPTTAADGSKITSRLPITTWCEPRLPSADDLGTPTLYLSGWRNSETLNIPASATTPQIANYTLMGTCELLPRINNTDVAFTKLSVNVGATNSIDSMHEHTCAIDPNKASIQCWGNNSHGQVDGKSPSDSGYVNAHSRPVSHQPIEAFDDATITDISAGLHHSCALAERGEENLYACWGDNSSQQLNLSGTNNGRLDTRGVQITAGDTFSCILDIRGELTCWGNFSTEKLTDKKSRNEYFVQIGAGGGYLCGLTNTSKLLCTGTVEINHDADDLEVDDLSVGFQQGCVTSRSSGQSRCWRKRAPDEVETFEIDGLPLDLYQLDLQDSNSSNGLNTHQVKQLAFGDGFFCYLGGAVESTIPDKVFCVGDGSDGELGVRLDTMIDAHTLAPFIADVDAATTIAPGQGQRPVDISAGSGFACLKTGSGQVRCWGNSRLGVLGNERFGHTLPIRIELPEVMGTQEPNAWFIGADSVSVGARHTCALFGPASSLPNSPGDVLCWGSGVFGQLARAHTFSQPTPTKTAQPFSPNYIATSSNSTCGLSNNELWCWGDNSSHTITPDDTNANKTFSSPMKVNVSAGDARGFALGDTHSCILAEERSGPMECWGAKEWRTPILNPDAVGTLGFDPVTVMRSLTGSTNLSNASFTNVTIRDKQTCVVANHSSPGMPSPEQSIVCWGEGIERYVDCASNTRCNMSGFYVLGTWTLSEHNIARLELGSEHLCAYESHNKNVHCWGNNDFGQLGKGEQTRRVQFPSTGTPFSQTSTVLEGVTSLSSLAVGGHHTCAVTESSGNAATLQCWGLNKDGQSYPYAPNTTQPGIPDQIIWQPTELPSPRDGAFTPHMVFTHSAHTCASYKDLAENDKLEIYCWGSNSHGQTSSTTLGVSEPETIDMAE